MIGQMFERKGTVARKQDYKKLRSAQEMHQKTSLKEEETDFYSAIQEINKCQKQLHVCCLMVRIFSKRESVAKKKPPLDLPKYQRPVRFDPILQRKELVSDKMIFSDERWVVK